MNLRLVCTGTRPLLLHNVQLASPLNPYAKRIKEISAKRVKTDEDHWERARLEFEAGLYYQPDIGPYIPSTYLLECFVNGARQFRAGKKIERGVVCTEFELPLLYQGPRDPDSLWNGGDPTYVDIRPVTVNIDQKVDRCRPIFRHWAVEAGVIIDPRVIELEDFTKFARLAGETVGIGDYRRMFGRFTVDVQQL